MDDRTTTGESPHELLLALAGRVDDDLLAGCRELVAVGEDGRALELLTATLIADRTALPPAERAALVAASRAARADLDADAALAAPVPEDATAHRFDADRPGIDALAAAVGSLPVRLVNACRTWVTFRLTPAGTAPGPLPHPVVVAEVDAEDTRPVDVLAYQLAIACARAGAPAAVEVVVAGAPRPGYQSAALRTARAVHGGNGAVAPDPAPRPAAAPPPAPPAPWPSQVTAPRPVETDTEALPVAAPPADVPDRLRDDPVPAGWPPASGSIVIPPAPRPATLPLPDRDATATQPGAAHPGPVPPGAAADGPDGSVDEVRDERPDAPADPPSSPVTPLRGTDQVPRPGPARPSGTGRAPSPSPARRTGRPLVPVGEQASVVALPIGRQQGVPADGPALASIGDPLLGDPAAPAAVPPRRDAAIDEDDPLGLSSLPPTRRDDPAEEPSSPVSDSWLSDWITGDWATRSGPDPLAAPPAPEPAPAPRPEPVAALPPPPAPPRRAPVVPPAPAAGQDGFAAKPESVARLSESDRALLARLQSELGDRPTGQG